MRSHWRPTRVVSLACVAVLATLAPAAAVAPPPQAGWIVQLGLGLGVEVPAPGYGVAASAVLVDGGHLDLVLETDTDGLTRVVADAPVAREADGPRIMGGSGACSDTAYRLAPYKWKTTWKWWFNASSHPEGVTRSKAENQLRAAVSSITGSRNDCGLADTVSARASYQGRTSTRPNFRDRTCHGQDGKNVVGFGSLGPNVLGLTCTTYQLVPGVKPAVESDVLFNKARFAWRTSVAGCAGRAILRSVATHEFGHVFGLDHVRETSHGQLTMSESIGMCDDSAFTLGLGDVLGLRKRY